MKKTFRENQIYLKLQQIWAKSSKNENEDGESLLEHTYRVLLSLREILNHYPSINKKEKDWLFYAAIIHDLGKIANAFQLSLRSKNSYWNHRHEVLSLAFIDWVIPQEEVESRKWISYIVLSHHKESKQITTSYPIHFQENIDDLIKEIDTIYLKSLKTWLQDVVPQWKEEMRFGKSEWSKQQLLDSNEIDFHQQAKKTILNYLKEYTLYTYRLSKGDDIDFYKDVYLGIILRGAILLSDHRASAGFYKFKNLDVNSIDDLLIILNRKREEIYFHQERIINKKESILLIAPTGSGKTESALIWARNANNGNIYYILPYQASMNAMYFRLNQFFPNKVGINHSKDIQMHFRRLMEQDLTNNQSIVIAKKLKNLVRLDQYPIIVTSPYQILKAMFRVKGYEKIIFQLQNSSIIVDEIHVYDIKRTAMLIKMFGYLQKKWHVRLLLMSATIPNMLKEILLTELEIEDIITADGDFYQKARRHKVIVKEGELTEELNFRLILDDIKEGKNVLIVCNTIARAQKVFDMVKDSKYQNNLFLLHGLLHGRDRQSVEQSIITKMNSLNGESNEQTVLVATQAVEVSLDVSFDVAYTDPAPLESLLQRFGRVNRKPFPPTEVKNVYVFKKPNEFKHIYDNYVIEKTLTVLDEQGSEFIIDESKINSWLDQVYSGKYLEDLKKEYVNKSILFETTIIDTLVPFMADSEINDQFYEEFDSVPVLSNTLLEEYLQLEKTSPYLAEELLVNVPWYIYKKYKIKNDDNCLSVKLVDLPYINGFGLKIPRNKEG